MKLYRGVRNPHTRRCEVWTEEQTTIGGRPAQAVGGLNPCLEVRSHSPAGFDWGYEGSGPAQLALALLMDATGGDRFRAEAHYQAFKRRFVARWDDRWFISRDNILIWLEHEERQAAIDGEVEELFRVSGYDGEEEAEDHAEGTGPGR